MYIHTIKYVNTYKNKEINNNKLSIINLTNITKIHKEYYKSTLLRVYISVQAQ